MWMFTSLNKDKSEEELLLEERKILDREIKLKKLETKRLRRLVKQKRQDKFQEKISSLPAKISKVNIEGIAKTPDDLLKRKVEDLFSVETFQDLISISKKVHRELKTMGCFRTVNIYVDTVESSSLDSRPEYEVSIKVDEIRPLFGIIGLIHGMREKEISLALRGGLNNLSGQGERMEMEFSSGTARSRQNGIHLYKPIQTLDSGSRIGISYHHSKTHLDWPNILQEVQSIGFKSVLNYQGFSLESRLGLDWTNNLLDWNKLRQKGSQFRWDPSIGLAGHSLIPNISNSLSVNLLDDELLPTHGLAATLSHVSLISPYTKQLSLHETRLLAKAHYPLTSKISLGWGFYMSHVCPHQSERQEDPLTETALANSHHRFQNIHMPLVFRGRDLRSLTQEVMNSTSVAYNLSVMGRLPLLGQNSLLNRHLRWHSFVSGHSDGSPSDGTKVGKYSLPRLNHFWGIGLVTKLSDLCLVELNYCIPIHGSSRRPGLYFSLGTTIL